MDAEAIQNYLPQSSLLNFAPLGGGRVAPAPQSDNFVKTEYRYCTEAETVRKQKEKRKLKLTLILMLILSLTLKIK